MASRVVMRGFDRHKLAALRLKEGWSATDLARFSAVDGKTILAWEAGTTSPSVDKLRLVTRALRVPVKALVRVPPRSRMLSDLRVLAELTQPEAARAVGVSTSYLTQLERGEKKLSDERAARLAELYRTDVATIIAAYERARLRPAGTAA